jgi:hypothetical protein
MVATTTATTSSAPIMYLLAANHDRDSTVEPENGAEREPERSAGRAVLPSVKISGDEAAEGVATPAALKGAKITFWGVALPAAAA